MNIMKDEVNIVKELPSHLKSLVIEAIGGLITDADIVKEATPIDYLTKTLPLLLQNGVVHFLGHRLLLGFDPLPSKLQFVPKIQEAGSLLIRRIRKYDTAQTTLDKQLVGEFLTGSPSNKHDSARGSSKYLVLHLRFEVDMIAYSLCDFGGGQKERRELQAYRESHFPMLMERLKHSMPVSSSELRNLGRCPLTPEEAALMLAGLGFKRGTYIYLASSHIYEGKFRMHSFTNLYPNLVTKETLLTPSELAPFRNFSSQLAELDFIACATADVFAMTDSGSQLSSLVSGFRTYYGGGHAPNLRPNKKRLAAILSENSTIGWNSFEDRLLSSLLLLHDSMSFLQQKRQQMLPPPPPPPRSSCSQYF
ncbi:O-fucosyltransferase 8 isoform X4 [Populus alba x Populus x berolinensis]|nr:O-fucosyltransferase 8 isoform X4 [Populus alba x Populus x berolinensis]